MNRGDDDDDVRTRTDDHINPIFCYLLKALFKEIVLICIVN